MNLQHYILALLLLAITQLSFSFELDKDWISGKLPSPSLFSANQYKNGQIINAINIFSLSNELKDINSLKEQFKTQKLHDLVAPLKLISYSKLSQNDCYQITISDITRGKEFTQIWKFKRDQTLVAQIENINQLSSKMTKEIFDYMEKK